MTKGRSAPLISSRARERTIGTRRAWVVFCLLSVWVTALAQVGEPAVGNSGTRVGTDQFVGSFRSSTGRHFRLSGSTTRGGRVCASLEYYLYPAGNRPKLLVESSDCAPRGSELRVTTAGIACDRHNETAVFGITTSRARRIVLAPLSAGAAKPLVAKLFRPSGAPSLLRRRVFFGAAVTGRRPLRARGIVRALDRAGQLIAKRPYTVAVPACTP